MFEGFLSGVNHVIELGWLPDSLQNDGGVTASSIPYEPGTIEAKEAWNIIDELAHNEESIVLAQNSGFDSATGWYNGKPLIPGAGSGHGDFDFLVDKLIYSDGYSPEVATNIAGAIRWGNS